MQKPISVEVDLDVEAAYVRYAAGDVAGTLDVWHDGRVAADLDDAGTVLGIEVLGLDEAVLSEAHRFALSRDLAFPTHLAASLVLA